VFKIWNATSQRCTGKSKVAISTNREIEKLLLLLRYRFNEFLEDGHKFSAEDLKNAFQGIAAVQMTLHVVELSLLLCYLPVATQHVYHIVDTPIAANHHRCENLQALRFRLYHNAPILRLKRINLMMHERFIKVKHPDYIVIVECICNNSWHCIRRLFVFYDFPITIFSTIFADNTPPIA
jgi:hypothetical protein